jgi:hypothetical protein
MNLIIIAIILALIPVIFWLLQYYFSKKQKILYLFKRHFSCFYLDWLFIPFNFFVGLSFNKINFFYLYLILGFSILINFFIHFFWFNLHKKQKLKLYMYDIIKDKIYLAGWMHIIFFFLEFSIVLYFLIFSRFSIFSLLAILTLALFFIFTNYASRKIHGKSEFSDNFFMISGILFLVLKFIFFYF